ncbi:MAG: SPOR domain-containing protein [Deltaproteobacteria bacterium]
MTFRKRFLLGAVGGLSVLILWGLVAEFGEIGAIIKHLIHADEVVLGYAVRVGSMFLAGGIATSVFNPNEISPAKLFQLGMAGPAILAAFLGAQGLGPPAAHAPASDQPSVSVLANVAHAEPVQEIPVTRYPSLVVPAKTKFSEGLFARRAPRQQRFYVIVGSARSREEAVQLAKHYANKFPRFKYVVYEPYKSKDYDVSIGSSASFHEAEKLRQKAAQAGFPNPPRLKAVP